jgi:hypothetical protein
VLTVTAVVGFALLGLVDDLAGSGLDGRGFRGHLRALASGRLTTGGMKLAGGVALGVVVCAPLGGRIGPLVVDAALVALAANVGNLFDRAPGRTTKVAILAALALALATGFDEELLGVAVVVGAALALLGADLGERLMLGDTGANAGRGRPRLRRRHHDAARGLGRRGARPPRAQPGQRGGLLLDRHRPGPPAPGPRPPRPP